jgi:hypothetical protein
MEMHLKKDIVFYPALILISIMIMFIQLSGCAAVNKGKTGHGRHTATATVISSDKSPYYDYLKAEILNDRGQYNLAVISIKKAIQKDPTLARFEPKEQKMLSFLLTATKDPHSLTKSSFDELRKLYPKIGDVLKQNFTNWNAFLLTSDFLIRKYIRLTASKKIPLFNGAIECRLFEYKIVKGSHRKLKES